MELQGAGSALYDRDPFIVKVTLGRPPTTFQVLAQAPNGVYGTIVFDGGR